jgi:hypothetical protein
LPYFILILSIYLTICYGCASGSTFAVPPSGGRIVLGDIGHDGILGPFPKD